MERSAPVRGKLSQTGWCLANPSTNLKQRAGPEGPARCVAQKDFGSVCSRCSCSKTTKAPVEGEQHPLDIEVDVEVPPELVVVSIDEPMIVLEIVEIGETIFGTERQIFPESPLEAATEGEAVGIEVIAVVEVEI
jgi:hypothetical protein